MDKIAKLIFLNTYVEDKKVVFLTAKRTFQKVLKHPLLLNGGDFKPNLEPLTKGLVKSGMSIKEYLEQENEKHVEIEPFEPSETWWNWLKKSLTATQCWIGRQIWQTKEVIGVFEEILQKTDEGDDNKEMTA